jgi:hypothetical protein
MTATACRILKRWTEENVPNDKKICGNVYSHYFNYKILSVLHQTKREGNKNFFDSYNKQGYNLLKQIFHPMFLEVIKQDLLNSEELSWVSPPLFKGQVKTANLKFHHFLTGVVAGSFPKKTFFDLTLIKTDIPVIHKWIKCTYHKDLENPLANYLDNKESLITLYFTVEDECLQLELIPKMQIQDGDHCLVPCN